MSRTSFIGCITASLFVTGCTTTRPPSIADDTFLKRYAETGRFSYGQPRSIKIVPDGSTVLYLRASQESPVQNLYQLDTVTGEERVLLTSEQILQGAEENLSVEERARRERMRLSAKGIASYHLSRDGTLVLAPLSGRLFVINRLTGDVQELESEHGYPLDPKFSPDGRFVSCVRDDELHVIDIASGKEIQLTHDAHGTITNARAEFVAQEEMGRRTGYWWSPDSASLAYQQTDTAPVETLHILDATHPEEPPQAWPYPRAGTDNAAVRLGLIPVGGGETTWVTWDDDRYPYLAKVTWKENAPLTVLVQNRRQTEEALLSVDTDNGYTSPLLVETDDAWLNLDGDMPHWLPDGSAFLWTTERNGTWQLELRGRDGHFMAPLTTVGFNYTGFVHLDDEDRAVYVTGGDDPTQRHVFKVSLDSPPRRPVQLTEEAGMHSYAFSRDHSVYLHTLSTLDGSHSRVLHRANGETIGEIGSVGVEPPFVPNLELTKVGGTSQFDAAIIRPRNFQAGVRYPVIVYVYGGPHHAVVKANPRGYLLQQWIADHGYIVVAIDGRGTPSRGRAWERITKNNLIDVPLQDQVDALKALGRKYHELDLSRVGMYGWSFGGYFSAMAAMRRPDVYDAGVAGAPVADWRDYDTHYTERYMGLPDENAVGYEKASVLTYAAELEVPLLIIHGTADDNVYFTHSMKMSDALFRAGKHHELLVLSDFTHMVRDPLVTTRLYKRIMDFFDAHVAGAGRN